jgi:DASH complex subunit SPC19
LAALSTTLAPQIDTLMSRAEHLVEIERSRISSMEETVRILQKGPSLAPGPGRNQAQNQETDEDDAEKEGAGWGDKLSGVEMDGMTVVQRRKVTMLRNKRERMIKAFAEAGVVVPGHDI